jgi:hypothetical protein
VRAASDQVATVILAATLDGVCYFGGVIDGGALDVRVDPTGAACSPELFAELEDTLGAVPRPVTSTLSRAVDDAYRFASLGLSGPVSLAGFAAAAPVVTVVSDGGASAVLSFDGWCVTVALAAPETAERIYRCP